jgi:ankyrin repeat protein
MKDAIKSFQGNLNNIRDINGNTLLILASIYGDFKMVKLLIGAGLNTNIKNSDGNIAMHYAASVKSYQCMRALIDGGTDENLENKDGKTPWELF